MPKRQFANFKIEQLEKLFDEKRDKPELLQSILGELTHRTTPRSRELKRRVVQALSVGAVDNETGRILKPLTPEDHRFSAEYFLRGQPDWTLEERTEAAALARHLLNLAKLAEKRLANEASSNLQRKII